MNASVNNRQPNRLMANSGFTLIELMVTIAVLAIIVSIAAPSISTQLANQRVKSTASTITSILKDAKVESVIRRQNIQVVYSDTAKTIVLKNTSGTVLTSYDINSRSTVSITPNSTNTVTFQPNKVTANGVKVTYTICDNNTAATPRKIEVSTIASISHKLEGTC
ncbi:pilus assembly FimT family protein [Psychrobacter sp. T6-6]|uniref:pilus assembly FimT family protein n=1 Tax=Psychrobacter sp. T6-6 TaxID=3457452 RepID=UPI003FCF6EBB